jgi:hypothetical protein
MFFLARLPAPVVVVPSLTEAEARGSGDRSLNGSLLLETIENHAQDFR